jgi:2,5-dihydroxypyridine 5,6-dioxygenase
MRAEQFNPASLAALFRKEFQLCNVKRGETVVLLTDLNTRREYVQAGFSAADELGAAIYEVGMSRVRDSLRVGHEPVGEAKGVREALKCADLVCAFFPPNFSNWQHEVRAAGTRVLSIGDAPDELARLISPPGLKEAVLHAAARWGTAKKIQLLSDAGTDLTWTRGEFAVKSQYGFAEEKGRYDMWGGGHITNFPDEGSANGTVVLKPGDLWILPYVRAIESTVKLEVRDGFIRKVEGGLDAKAFTYWLDRNKRSDNDLDPYAVSHLGFGMHPGAHWDNIMTYGNELDHMQACARTFAGNFLFSTGPNNDMGGKRDTKGHIDTPMCDCTVLLDGEIVLEKGRFKDPKLIVESPSP